MKIHSFQEDLPKGHGGEKMLHGMYDDLLIRTDGKRGDFIWRPDKKILELKCEISYSATIPSLQTARDFRDAMSIKAPKDGWRRTDNLFVEKYSSEADGSPGGPWQAQTHSAEYYVHFFFGDGSIFAYRTDEMVDFMNENEGRYRLRPVRNEGYTTMGYPVPRADVAKLEIHSMFPAWIPTPV